MIPADDPWADGLPTLRGTRVCLRQLTPGDAPAQLPIYGDPEVARLGFAPPMKTLEDALALVASTERLAQERTIFHWGLALLEGDLAVGHMTLFKLEAAQGRAEVGYSLRRDLWNQGLATEGLALLLGFAFERLGLRRIEADADPRNLGSLRVLEKQGFQREGYCRERWNMHGELQDGVLLGLLRREWVPPPRPEAALHIPK